MQKRHLGMTIVELSLSMLLISVIFVLTVPGILTSSTLNTSLYRAKNFCKDLVAAEQTYTAQSSATPASADLISNTKFVGMQTTGTYTGTSTVPGPTCSTTNPCYLYSDGSAVYAGFASSISAPTFKTPYTTMYPNAVAPLGFTYDPDSSGNLPPTTLILDWNTNRLTSYDAYCSDTVNISCSSTSVDPDYIKIWTQMP